MSKEENHIDNLFKEKLDGRSFDGPPTDFLADLNQRLDNKPVVSKGWIWILFLNLFIIGLFLVNATIDSQTTKTAQVDTQIDNKAQHSVKEKSLTNDNIKSKSNSVNSTDAKSTNTEETNTKEFERYSSSEFNSDELGTSEAETNTTESNGVEKNQANVSVRKSSTQKTNNNREDSSKNNTSESDNASNTTAVAKSKDSNQSSKEASNSSTKKEGQAISKGTGTEENKEEEKSTTKNTDSNKESVLLNGTELISSYVSYSAIYAPEFEEVNRKIKINDFPEFPYPWNNIVAENYKDAPKETPEQKDDKKSMFEIQLEGGATHWRPNTLGTNDVYVNKIDESGTPKWTPNFGLAFHANFNRVSVGTGVQYAKFKTENLFEFSEVSTYDSTYIGGYNQTYTYDSLGNIIDSTSTPYYDSTTVTDTTYNTSLVTNEYEWIQIPLHIGYRFNLNQWAIIPRIGMNIGIGIRQTSGQYPNEVYDELQILSPVKWYLNLHTSLEVRREFGKWHAFGKFNYQRNLTPTIDNALFERKYTGIGFNFGVGYSF